MNIVTESTSFTCVFFCINYNLTLWILMYLMDQKQKYDYVHIAQVVLKQFIITHIKPFLKCKIQVVILYNNFHKTI